MNIDLSKLPRPSEIQRNDKLLYSESAGRLIVTVAPENQERFEKIMKDHPVEKIGKVKGGNLEIKGLEGQEIIDLPVDTLEERYKERFGDKI